ncbi:DUF523 domain-containing protein [Butyricicoccus intestinisimiae]|uniref:DUF523 domain-containing protein n=1 Tax=Butyricicoccus intestinisimiae TaxID=2841509 RepID=A0ABS6EU64_9FIRM|nr:DUF523 domain-containing protein [Butyricicoccus intestinisimiae]MBU5491234.1 DUF523 domain-containing protein [Butyricicoccus intestinisimiae]
MTVLVSACLLGENCKYNGGNNCSPAILDFLKDKQVIPICPEILAGMPAPRPPVEVNGSRVLRKNGEDVTDAYCSGVCKAMQIAAQQPIDLVILKSRSPTCGVGQRYDGTFTGTLVNQSGLFAEALQRAGYSVKSSDDF